MKADISVKSSLFKKIIKTKNNQRIFLVLITIMITFLIIHNGAIPRRYNLNENQRSIYDINAPRDIENIDLTEKKALEEMEKIGQSMDEVDSDNIIKVYDDVFDMITDSRYKVDLQVENKNLDLEDEKLQLLISKEIKSIKLGLEDSLANINIKFSDQQREYLISKEALTDSKYNKFKSDLKRIVRNALKEEITDSNIDIMKITTKSELHKVENLESILVNIGEILIDILLIPNRVVNYQETDKRKAAVYEDIKKTEKVIIKNGERIINKGDIITKDKLNMLIELDLIEKDNYDFRFAASILFIIILLTIIIIIYLNTFCKELVNKINIMILTAVIIIITLLLARVVLYLNFTPLSIPIFIAPMLITLLIDVRLSIVINFVLSITISLLTKGDIGFLFIAIISGTMSSFIVNKSDQRSKLSIAGVSIACLNVLVIISLGVINTSYSDLFTNSVLVFSNGIISTIFTIGTLQIWESLFNIVTPLKLLELANPNHPLIKRMLMEAPGTYHHSLLVGNLAEVATESIDGDPLLSRVGAYYHDVGKIKRPHFFKENQFVDNPHDKMTPNLSTLVITSHPSDGLEFAKKYKIPQAIKDIIVQHHGTTLVAYFYVKAKKGDKADLVREEDFRYEGPKPETKEAAVVMLADSVEAAVRSMPLKTEGKIEGLVRKIIKDKLDDGQLDLSELTLKDLDKIAKSFLSVLSGYFHQRTEYPKLNNKKSNLEINYNEKVDNKLIDVENVEDIKKLEMEKKSEDNSK